MITKLRALFNKKAKKTTSFVDLMDGAIPVMEVKKGRETSTSRGMKFIEEYEKSKPLYSIKDIPVDVDNKSQKQMEMSKYNRRRLAEGIVISLEFKVDRRDLEFVANSRIDGKPVYLYIGNDFRSFNLPYEEVVSSADSYIAPTRRYNSNTFQEEDFIRKSKKQESEFEKMNQRMEKMNSRMSDNFDF